MSEKELLTYLIQRIDALEHKLDKNLEKLTEKQSKMWTRLILISAAVGLIASKLGVKLGDLL